MTVLLTTADEVQRAVRENARLRVRGAGTKSSGDGEGPVFALARLTGVTEYSPAECVFTALAGTRVREIAEVLAGHGQYLPFDPPFADDGATIGGTVASGVSGPGRYRYGGVRDFIIGMRVVDGEGRHIRSGGKVVKNAAGFLLHHGMVGSLGEFGVITEVTFKVFPQPEARRIIMADCGSVSGAWTAAKEVERLRCECEAIDFDERGRLRIGLAGRAAVIDARASRLTDLLGTGRASCAAAIDPASVDAAAPGSQPDPSLSCVKVAGLMNSWEKLRDHITSAQFMCAGSVAWLSTNRLPELASALRNAQLTGLVIRGPHAGQRVGHLPHNEFETRVKRVLDPHNKFRAASDPRR